MVSSQIHKQHPKSVKRREEESCSIWLREWTKIIVNNTRPGIQDMIFIENKDGLYYKKIRNTKGVSMISSMEVNFKHYNQQQYESAKTSR